MHCAKPIDSKVQNALVGHRDGDTGDDYGKGFSLARLNKEIKKVRYPSLKLDWLAAAPGAQGRGLRE
jgi:hypothetical protein